MNNLLYYVFYPNMIKLDIIVSHTWKSSWTLSGTHNTIRALSGTMVTRTIITKINEMNLSKSFMSQRHLLMLNFYFTKYYTIP